MLIGAKLLASYCRLQAASYTGCEMNLLNRTAGHIAAGLFYQA